MSAWSRWNTTNNVPGWQPSSLSDTLEYGEGGSEIGFGVPAVSVYLKGPAGTDRDGPTAQEIADGWVFGEIPHDWPKPNPWYDQGWGRQPVAIGAPVGTIQSWPIWYRWKHGAVATPPGPPPPPPPDPTPVLNGSDPTWGQTIPQSFGTRRVDGVPLWVGPVVRTGNTEPVGAVSFAVAFGTTARPSPNDRLVTLSKLWADTNLIYDVSSGTPTQQGRMNVTFYGGKTDQMPDPTLLAARGELCPAYRDMFYAVITGYPLNSKDNKLPHIRAELHDAAAYTAPQQVAMDLLDPPTVVDPDFMITDFDTGTAYAISSPFAEPHTLHAYDLATSTEVSAIIMNGDLINLDSTIDPPLQYAHLATDWWSVYDKDNLLFHAQHCSAISNGMRIGTWRIDTGQLIASFGNSRNDTISSPSNIAFSDWADLIKFRAFGTELRALVVGDIFQHASILTYRKQIAAVSGANQTQLDYVGILKPTDNFELSNDFTHDFGANDVHSVLAYPVLDRPELISSMRVDTLDRQDVIALVGAGSQLYVYSGGIVGRSAADQGTVGPASWATTDDMRALYDFGALQPRTLFIDPTSGCIMVVAMDVSNNGMLYQFLPTFVQGEGGAVLQSIAPLYMKPISNVDPRLLSNSIKNNNMSAGTFAYYDGDIVIRSLSTGDEIYRHAPATPVSDNWSYDSVTQNIVDLSSGGSPAVPQTLSLGGATSDLVPINDFLTWTSLKLGYAQSDVTVDGGITDTVIGGNIASPTPARGAMTTACAMFGIYAVEVSGKVSFVRPAQGSNATVSAVLSKDDLSYQQEGQMTSLSTTSLAAADLPADIKVTYLDPANDYKEQSQTFRRNRFPFQTAKTRNLASYSAPLVVTATQAMNIAGRIALTAYGEATTYEYRLPFRFARLLPADVVGFLNDDRLTVSQLSQIVQVQYNGDWSMTLKGVRWSLSDTLTLSVDSPSGAQNVGGTGPSDSVALAADTSLIDPSDISPGAATVYTGAGSLGQAWWKSARVDRLLDASTVELYLATQPVAWGIVSETLPPTEVAQTTFATDNDTVLTVTGRGMTANMFTSISAEECRAGLNAALIGNAGAYELVYFQNVEKVTNTIVKLTGLLRGRRGTNVNCDTHKAGDTFILVKSNGARALLRGDHIDLKYRGSALSYYATGERTSRPAPATAMTFQGNSEKPWTVRRLRAKFASEVNAVNATSYDNECGMGNRSSLIQVVGLYNIDDGTVKPADNIPSTDWSPAHLVDGFDTSGATHSTIFADGQTGVSILFSFVATGFKQVIDEFTWIQNNPTTMGAYTFEASQDQVTWTSLATGLDLPASGGIHAFTNTTGYWYYRLRQTGGSTSSAANLKEIQFKCKAEIVDANDILITWLRRDRMAPAALWVTDDQPMTEGDEVYQVEIFPADPNNSGTWPKVLPLASLPRAVYTAAQQSTDGQTPPLVQLGVRVTQLGTGGPDDVTKRLGYQFTSYTVVDVG